MSMKQMEVSIMGQIYLLACPEGGDAVLAEAVTRVDREMCAIRDAGRVKARERIAKGFQFVTVSSDARLMAAGSQQILSVMRAGASPTAAGGGY